jgi:hypothetical protein
VCAVVLAKAIEEPLREDNAQTLERDGGLQVFVGTSRLPVYVTLSSQQQEVVENATHQSTVRSSLTSSNSSHNIDYRHTGAAAISYQLGFTS